MFVPIFFFLAVCLLSSANPLILKSSINSKAVGTKRSDCYTRKTFSLADNVVADANIKVETSPVSGQASILSSTFNLAKSIIGAGVLSLPGGVAILSDSPKALVPAIILTILMGAMSAYSFSLIGRSCLKHNSKSFQDAWAKSVDPKSAWFISFAITAKCFLASLAYSIIIGDTFSSLFKTFGLPDALSIRPNAILLITSCVLTPLCSLKSLNALSPFSLLGLGGTFYTAIFMAIRYIDKSYFQGGKFFNSVMSPRTLKSNALFLNPRIFVLVSMLSTSYIAHYNAPKFLAELKDPTIRRFNDVTRGAFGLSILTFVFMMSVGFLTFKGNSLGFILNNYSGKDSLATFARVAIGGALLTGYPFTFSALREGILDMLKLGGNQRDRASGPLTLALISVVTVLAILLKDVGFVVSFSGAMFGCILMFVIPAMMNIADLKSNANGIVKSNQSEIATSYGMIFAGFAMTLIGVSVSVLKQLGKL